MAEEPLRAYDSAWAHAEDFRAELTGLTAAPPASMAITDNTSRASALAIRLIDRHRPSGNVVIDSTAYPSSIYGWLTAGSHEIRVVHEKAPYTGPMTEEILAHTDRDTTAVVVSHVCPLTGRRRDIEAIGEALRGTSTALVVDGAQSVGVLPLDLGHAGVDLLVGTTMKWLLGVPGTGFLYVSPELEVPQLDIGYAGVVDHGGDWPRTVVPEPLPGARRLEPGMPGTVSLAAAAAGIRVVRDAEVRGIHRHVEHLVDRVIEVLDRCDIEVVTPRDPRLRAGVVAGRCANAAEVSAYARDHAVDIGGYPWGLLRIDPHAYCTERDIERLEEVLAGAPVR